MKAKASKKIVLPVEIQPLDEGGYLAVCESIQGCHAQGQTIAEALDILEDVARILLELQRELGLPLPEHAPEFGPNTVLKAEFVVSLPK
jgi:predicted RNase H-like HicB family nuclease